MFNFLKELFCSKSKGLEFSALQKLPEVVDGVITFPAGWKLDDTVVAVQELGENDLIVLHTQKILTQPQRDLLKEHYMGAFHDKSQKYIVLEGGLQYSIIKRI